MKQLLQKLHNRALPFLLAVLMLASSLPLNVISLGTDSAPSAGTPAPDGYIYDYDTLEITLNGEEISAMQIYSHEKITISADGVAEEATYQWQIQHNENENTWINIYDATSKELPVSLALVGNLLRADNTAKLRCRAYTEDYAYLTSPVTVTVTDPTETTVTTPTQTKQPATFAAEGDASDTPEFVTVTINYVKYGYVYDLEKNDYVLQMQGEAFSPYVATLVYNGSLTTSVNNPTIVGFDPFVGDSETSQPTVEIDLANVTADVTYTVNYKPAQVPYEVHYLFQGIYDDLYVEDSTVIGTNEKNEPITGAIYEGTGVTGLQPEDGVEGITFQGFTSLYYQPDTIAADGSTVFEVYFERNYYLMEFDCNGGYGVNTVYVRYGTYISIPYPIRAGYVFDSDGDGNGWDLIETEQQGYTGSLADGNADPLPSHMPPYNSSYKAIWERTATTYTVVYWAENANDTDYSYWGMTTVNATSADLVSGADHSTAPSSLKDYEHFTYNEELTLFKESQRDDLQDGKVIVEGDGSTVVNVYYSRKVYTITFTDSNVNTCQIDEHKHTEECYTYICDSHIHTDECYKCGKEENPHTSACCSLGHDHASCEIGTCTHLPHDITCYTSDDVSIAQNAGNNGFNIIKQNYPDPEAGKIYRYRRDNRTYYNYVYVGGQWYALANGSGNSVSGLRWQGTNPQRNGATAASSYTNTPEDCSHVHEDDCYTCGKKAHNHESGCDIVNCSDPSHHSHSEGCLECTSSHIHTSDCPQALICEKPEHTHSSDDRVFKDTIVKILTRKYGSYIGDEWKFTTDKGTTYPKAGDVSSWNPKGSEVLGQRLAMIEIMPGDDFELQYYPQDNATRYYNYYIECLNGEEYVKQFNGKNYKYYYSFGTLEVDFNIYTVAEDFISIAGFTKNVVMRGNQRLTGDTRLNAGDVLNFYYTRNQYKFKYFNHNDYIQDGSSDLVKTLQYQTPLKAHQLTKEYMEANHYPSTLEPGAYEFDAWYTTASCFPGTEVDWSKDTMPDGDLTVYAKWVPVTRNVTFYHSYDKLVADDPWQPDLDDLIAYPIPVPHGKLLGTTYHMIPTWEGYEFVGWFYFDENGRKKFAPDSMAVTRDLDLFAEWKSATPTTYEITYQAWKIVDGVDSVEDGKIADPIYDYSTAGKTVTFQAKAGTLLYEKYQTGWFPASASHSILMNATSANNKYTFKYYNKEYINYKIVYKNRVTGEIFEESDPIRTTESIVSVKYKPFEGYYPEQYYIQRAIAYDPVDYDEFPDHVSEENILYFYYVPDDEHAPFHVKHHKQNLDGTYTEAESEQGIADLEDANGNTTVITANAKSYNGYKFARAEVTSYEENAQGEWEATTKTINDLNAIKGALSIGGLEINIYYDRIPVGYTVQYVEYGTTNVLHAETGEGLFGATITHPAPAVFPEDPIEGDLIYIYIDGSDASEEQRTKQLEIRANSADNVLIFYYNLKKIQVNYHVVCTVPSLAENNRVSLANERAATPSGLAGSKAMSGIGFQFVGWYYDEACTQAVPSEWVTEKDGYYELIPKAIVEDTDGEEHFYALFEPIYGKLQINKTVAGGDGDSGDTFLFRVKGKDHNNEHIDIIVSITDASPNVDTVLLNKVPIGNYTVTELTDWSWEYTTGAEECTAIVEKDTITEVSFTNNSKPSNWLSDETVNENQFNP
ncbi:MAG: InlB B-repeat-containing protein [Clostridia bacterium]|nr:InlB B-repeat-containing protein [Clostridia bacterium]